MVNVLAPGERADWPEDGIQMEAVVAYDVPGQTSDHAL
jgi:hypothetical protein